MRNTDADGPELLRVWMAAERVTLAEVAAACRSTINQVSRWRHGAHAPEEAAAMRLDAYSAGAVPMSAWGYAPVSQEVAQHFAQAAEAGR